MSKLEFEKAIGDGVVLVHFFLPWGASCRLQVPIVDKLAEKFEGKAVVGKLNLSENKELAAELGITGVPTLVIFRNGKEIRRFVGLQSLQVLSEAIDTAMKEPRKKSLRTRK